MRPRALLTLVLTVIAIPVAYHVFIAALPTPPPPQAPQPNLLKLPNPELPMIHIKLSDPPRRLDVPGREFVPPLPVG